MFVTFITIPITPFENLCFSVKLWTIEILVLTSWIPASKNFSKRNVLYQNQEVIQPGIPNSHYQLPLTSHQQTFAINYEIIQGKSTITSRYNFPAFILSENFLCQASVSLPSIIKPILTKK